jgi:hypothetical protein
MGAIFLCSMDVKTVITSWDFVDKNTNSARFKPKRFHKQVILSCKRRKNDD